MALIDPCVALPFDPKTAHLADEREANTDDQPLTPTTPTTPTSPTGAAQHAHMTASASASASAAPSTPASSSSSSSSSSSAAQSGTSTSPAHLTTLPTVLQSVFSYIFTDHQNNNGQQLHAANSLTTPTTPAPLSPPHTPTAHVVSSPVTPLSSASLPSAAAAPPAKSSRHCAILDLDETLLHSFFPDKVTPYQYQYMVMKCKAQEADERDGRLLPSQRTLYQVDVGDGTIVVLMLRPHLRAFLDSLFATYDVGVWSAGGKLYVDAICRVLFPPDAAFRPLFQLCWDDVQVETNGLSSYTKPLTTLISRFSQLSLPTLFLVDNRKENGLHFPAQLVIAPDYLPRPWEWNGDRDRDEYLHSECMASIAECVECMKGREMGRLDVGLDVEDMEEEEEEAEEEEDESEMGVEEDDDGDEQHDDEHEQEVEAEDEDEEAESGVDEHEHFTSDDEAEHRAAQLDSSMYDADGADEAMDDEALANAYPGRSRPSQKTAA